MGEKGMRTQRDRRESTRRIILDGAVDSLMELGFSKTTTLEVQKRAGVSRGALLHHFPAKAELLVATIDHLAKMRGIELNRSLNELNELPHGDSRVAQALELIWRSFSGPLFYVAMELRVAARSDAELRAALTITEEKLYVRIMEQSRTLFGPEIASKTGFEFAMDTILQIMIGSPMTALLHGASSRVDALIDSWKELFPKSDGRNICRPRLL